MSWKFVFNSTVGDKRWGHIDHAQEAAKSAGYKFFTWNGLVFGLDKKETGLEIKDLF